MLIWTYLEVLLFPLKSVFDEKLPLYSGKEYYSYKMGSKLQDQTLTKMLKKKVQKEKEKVIEKDTLGPTTTHPLKK